MQRTNIYLDDDQLRALKHLAAEEHANVAALVRRAVDEFLGRKFQESNDWSQRFEALVAQIQSRIPSGVTPDQIEADITSARDEYRQLHGGTRASSH
jgi:Arc/MetJ family transcription regulator